jgi:hypothetical protein
MVVFGAGCSDDSGGTGGSGTGGSGTGGSGTGGSGTGGSGTGGTGGSSGGIDLCADAGGSGTVEFPQEITEDTRLTPDCDYLLTENVGSTFVTNGAVLTIDPGVTVRGEQAAALIVTTEGRIEADGSAEAPIVFTSAAPVGARNPGDWGGVVLLGRSRINRLIPDGCDGTAGECTDSIEGIEPDAELGTFFGGDDDAHNCGTLRYVRIEYAGFIFGEDNELNALTVGACGTQTTLEYIQLHRGEDDGLEFFGSTADAQYILVTGTGDDGLDTDQSYSGTISNAIVHHFAGRSDDPRGIEADNWNANQNAEPRSNPTFQYITLIGDAGSAQENAQQGAVIRRGSFGTIEGGVIVDFNRAGVDIRDSAWAQSGGYPDNLNVTNTCFNNNSPNLPTDVDCGGAGEEDCNDEDPTEGFFPEDVNLATGNFLEEDPQLGDVSGAVDGSGSPDYSVGNSNCMGAFAPDGTDWTAGWTEFSVN